MDLKPYQVALAWLLSRTAVASRTVGGETIQEKEITANATAADVTVEQAQSDVLMAATRPEDI